MVLQYWNQTQDLCGTLLGTKHNFNYTTCMEVTENEAHLLNVVILVAGLSFGSLLISILIRREAIRNDRIGVLEELIEEDDR